MAYSGGLTREQFMFSEMRITARLKQSGLSDKEILEKVYKENLFQYPTEKEIKSKCKACLKRLKAIENMPAVTEALVSGTVSEAKQAAMIAMMRQSQLLAEFMVTVIGTKYRILDLTLTRKDLNIFFHNLQQSDEVVGSWSESTINKLKVVFRTCLREAGYIHGIGKLEEFMRTFEDVRGESWINSRDDFPLLEMEIVETVTKVTDIPEQTVRNWFNGVETAEMSIDRLSREIKEYIDGKESNFHLVFLIDEIGQFIGDDGNMMLNLQTIVEDLGSRCNGKVWVIVTSQEDIDSVTHVRGNDFSKIQGRFYTRLSLSASSADEVVKRRILAKTPEADTLLRLLYHQNASAMKNLFSFSSDTISDLKGYTVEFWHENYHVRNKVTRVGRAGKLLSGVINFGNDIGFSDLVFLVDGHQYLKITIEVFPSKISYKEDYLAIVADVTKEVYNLVFDFLRKTYESFDVSSSRQSSPVEFFAIIQKIYGEYIAAADMVLRSPHHLLQQESEVLPQHKIRRCDGKTLRWLEKHPGQMVRGENGIRVEKALAVRKYVTYDTRENRLTKYMLEQTARRLEQFRKQYELMSQNTDPVVLDRIRGMVAGIQRRCNVGFMKDVSSEPSGAGMSLVFGMAPGYRQLYRCYLLLQHGLAVTGSVFNISVKDLAVLYEYWCFIKLNSLMKDKYELVSQDIIRTNGTGLSVSLIKGQRSRVKYRDLKTSEVITLSYNPSAVNVPTVSQRPDNVLRLEKKGAETDYEYVFDAKYRINPSVEGTDYHLTISKTPGPEVDDINTMHRYRDAIVYHHGASPFERTMFGAYVLFPYANEEEYRHHRFFESIDKVNIGGLPFLPTATSMVTDMLDDLIDDSPESAFERATLPKGIESKLKKVNWSCRDVLVGPVRRREQLAVCLEHRFYYVPIGLLPQDKLPIHEVAIYQPKDLYGREAGIEYYGEVVSLEKVPRREITEIPRESDDLYYRVNVREWMKLDRRIEAKEYGVRSAAFTNDFLLKHSSTVPELFQIKTGEEYRFFTELKRVAGDAVLINDDSVTGFEFGDYKVIFEYGEIKLFDQTGLLEHCTINDFIRKPNAEFRGLKKRMTFLEENV